MRLIYLIRHCEPETAQTGRSVCLGNRSDPDLSERGREQAEALKEALRYAEPEAVFASPLKRALSTASCLSDTVVPMPAFTELGMGEWDGLTFDEIRERYPQEYAARGEHPGRDPVPGGEAPSVCRQRGLDAFRKVLEETSGNVAIVSHAGILRLLLSSFMGLEPDDFLSIPQPYGAVNVFAVDGDDVKLLSYGAAPGDAPDGAAIGMIYELAGTPDHIREHCFRVRQKALELGSELPFRTDRGQIIAAAMLHDAYRLSPDHEKQMTELLRRIGFPRTAEIVKYHNGGFDYEGFDEAKLVFLADKYTLGTEEVSIEERYRESLKKCDTPEAVEAHRARLTEALEIEDEYRRQIR